jgi:hypothetical protein
MVEFARKHFILTALFLAVGVTVALFLRRSAIEQAALDEASTQYADQAVIAVASNWDKHALLARGSDELLQAARLQIDLDAQFAQWSMLGSMLSYQGVKGAATVAFSVETGKIITALYFATAKFQRGDAEIRVGLVERMGKWEIGSFQVFPVFVTPHFLAPSRGVKQL